MLIFDGKPWEAGKGIVVDNRNLSPISWIGDHAKAYSSH